VTIELWEPKDLYLLREDPRMDAVPSYFLDNFFTLTHFSEDEKIWFADLPEADRFMAPFVLPYEQGKPTYYDQGYAVESFKPPYIKLKDEVRPTDAAHVSAKDFFLNGGRRPSLVERFDALVVKNAMAQIRRIRMREAWMAARAFIDAKVQIDYDRDAGENSPSVLLDFGRDAGHTVTLTADYWSDPATDILGDIETWAQTMIDARNGGTPSLMLVGSAVAPVFKNNTGIKAMLDTNYRGGDSVQIDRGILLQNGPENPLTFIGQLKTGMPIYSYKDTVDVPNGSGGRTKIDLFNPKDIMLIAPGATGVRAYGAIYDVKALAEGVLTTDIFPRMWQDEGDPGGIFVMHQSSPLPIPLYPNCTFKARVLA
jgi:hypothetical protein